MFFDRGMLAGRPIYESTSWAHSPVVRIRAPDWSIVRTSADAVIKTLSAQCDEYAASAAVKQEDVFTS